MQTNQLERYSTQDEAKVGMSLGREAYLAKKPMYFNFGLGAMTPKQRDQLLREGKIIHKDGMDMIAVRQVGVIEYAPAKSDVLKRQTFEGMEDIIQFRLREAESIVKQDRAKLIKSEIEEWPAWDGVLPTV